MANVAPFNRLQAFTINVPAGTTQAAPQQTSTAFNSGVLVGIEIEIPNGHVGLTGLQIASAHVQVLPITPGQWIVGNGSSIEWALEELTDTGNWQAIAYNTDKFAHSFYLRFLVSDFIGRPSSTAPVAPPLQLA